VVPSTIALCRTATATPSDRNGSCLATTTEYSLLGADRAPGQEDLRKGWLGAKSGRGFDADYERES
jgi:hypothetical protein